MTWLACLSCAKKITHAASFDMEDKIKLEKKFGQNVLMTRFAFQLHALRVPSFRAGDLGIVVMAWKGLEDAPRTYACNETETFQVRAESGGEIEINRSIDIPIMTPSGEEWKNWQKLGNFEIHGELPTLLFSKCHASP